jgi:hypothetical protein
MSRFPTLAATIVLASVSLWFTANAQAINITGSVVDNGTSAGIGNAKVTLVEFPSCTTRTDANGAFTLSAATATRPQTMPLASGRTMVLSGNRLTVNADAQMTTIIVDVYTILGRQMFHAEKCAAGIVEFASLWKTPGLYYVKVRAGNEQRILSSFGTNQTHTMPSHSNSTPAGLSKINAVYTIEAGKSGYDSKQAAMSALTGSAGVIRLSTNWQTPGTWKECTPNADAKAGFTGVVSVIADPVRKSDLWFAAADRGVYKTTDYGITWTHVNTTPDVNSGRPWFLDVEKDPNRDPARSPVLWITEGYGSGGPFVSSDGGVNWTYTWHTGATGNLYEIDGVTKSNIGNNMCGVLTYGSAADHCIAYIHTYYWDSTTTFDNGLYRTTNSGTSWKLIDGTQTFNMGAHQSRPIVLDSATWCVQAGQDGYYPNFPIYRTTDAGVTWAKAVGTMTSIAARSVVVLGSTAYAGSQVGGLFKTTDKGAHWTSIRNETCNWVAASATRIYVLSATAGFISAPLGNDATWTSIPGSVAGGECAASTFDGTHWIIFAAQQGAGIMRYVEP